MSDFNLVGCTFHKGGQVYDYKTHLSLDKGDKAVVDVNGDFKVVDVVCIYTYPALKKGIKYKWIVSKVDMDHYAAEKASDNKPAVNTIRYESTPCSQSSPTKALSLTLSSIP